MAAPLHRICHTLDADGTRSSTANALTFDNATIHSSYKVAMQTLLPADILAVAMTAFLRLIELTQQFGHFYRKRLAQDAGQIQPQRRGYASSNRI